jgi:hypothetical protein
VCLCGAGIVLLTAPAATAAPAPVPEGPNLLEIGAGPAVIPDRIIATSKRRLQDSAFPGFLGGTYTTSTGESVTVYSSPSYTGNDALNQQWANFLSSLVHGSELSSVTLYLAPLADVQSVCGGPSVLACYGANSIIAPGEDAGGVSAEAIIAHEYGHHVAAHRSNAPWDAIDWGPKRWSSYEQVCSKAASKQLFPGSEDPLTYQLNPGEAWAETYRVLNEHRLGLPETPWDIVSESLYPDSTALALAQQDVLTPWSSDRTTTLRGSFAKRGVATRSFTVSTPFDGTATASVKGAKSERLSLNLHTTTVCGARTVTFRVKRLRGSGAFTLKVARP